VKGEMSDFDLYVAARRVADIVFEYASPDVEDEMWLEDRREEAGVSPSSSQTASGLFLELYYGQPSMIWTPWGCWGFGGSSGGWWKEALPKLLERLGATLHTPEAVTHRGHYGPVYAIHKVDDMALPEPVERPKDEFIPRKEAGAIWKTLTERYETSK